MVPVHARKRVGALQKRLVVFLSPYSLLAIQVYLKPGD
jgi:hypothetical protein